MGWQFYGLCTIVALLGLNTLMQVTVIQTLLDVKRLLEKRADGELRDLLAKTELIVEAGGRKRRKRASCQQTLRGFEQKRSAMPAFWAGGPAPAEN